MDWSQEWPSATPSVWPPLRLPPTKVFQSLCSFITFCRSKFTSLFTFSPLFVSFPALTSEYTLSEAWSGMNWADLMAAQGAFETDFYARSILRPKHPAYYRSGRPVIKISPKDALGSHEIRPIHSAPSLGQGGIDG